MKASNHSLLSLLCFFSHLLLVTSKGGLIGLGLDFYDPLCGYACKNSLLLPLDCSDAKVSMKPPEAQTTLYQTILIVCQGPLHLKDALAGLQGDEHPIPSNIGLLSPAVLPQ